MIIVSLITSYNIYLPPSNRFESIYRNSCSYIPIKTFVSWEIENRDGPRKDQNKWLETTWPSNILKQTLMQKKLIQKLF